MPPPDDSNFQPSSNLYTGPTNIPFSGFCLRLEIGETAEKAQYVMWANHTTAKLANGTLQIEENGSGGYAPDPGRVIVRSKRGVIKRNREDGRLVYYFDDGMPGSTVITFLSNKSSQKLDSVIGRFELGGSC